MLPASKVSSSSLTTFLLAHSVLYWSDAAAYTGWKRTQQGLGHRELRQNGMGVVWQKPMVAIRGAGAPEHWGSSKNWRQTRALTEKRSLKELAGKQPTNISYRNSSSFLSRTASFMVVITLSMDLGNLTFIEFWKCEHQVKSSNFREGAV